MSSSLFTVNPDFQILYIPFCPLYCVSVFFPFFLTCSNDFTLSSVFSSLELSELQVYQDTLSLFCCLIYLLVSPQLPFVLHGLELSYMRLQLFLWVFFKIFLNLFLLRAPHNVHHTAVLTLSLHKARFSYNYQSFGFGVRHCQSEYCCPYLCFFYMLPESLSAVEHYIAVFNRLRLHNLCPFDIENENFSFSGAFQDKCLIFTFWDL